MSTSTGEKDIRFRQFHGVSPAQSGDATVRTGFGFGASAHSVAVAVDPWWWHRKASNIVDSSAILS